VDERLVLISITTLSCASSFFAFAAAFEGSAPSSWTIRRTGFPLTPPLALT
jgi:hypothetical protein